MWCAEQGLSHLCGMNVKTGATVSDNVVTGYDFLGSDMSVDQYSRSAYVVSLFYLNGWVACQWLPPFNSLDAMLLPFSLATLPHV
jgi:hypothetical protein